MTLGRTSSGAIKIKTDEAGGGLRAVECACCGGASCGCSSMSAAVKNAIASATQVTVNGKSVAWSGSSASYQGAFLELSFHITYSNGILCFLGDTGDNTVALLPEPFTPQECFNTPLATADTITIQGEAYRSVNYFGDPLSVAISFS